MANDSLNYSAPVINLSLQQYDVLVESIAKTDALLQVALAANLEEIGSYTILYNFLWALHDIVYQAVELCSGLESQQKAAAGGHHAE